MTALSVLETVPACCPDEIWELIPAWPHEASSCGRLRSIDRIGPDGVWRLGQVLPLHPDKRKGKGYLYAHLRDGKRRRKVPVAVAVLEAHDKLRPGPEFEACHANDIRTDNHRSNLSWDTWQANRAQMWERRRVVTTEPCDALICHRSQVRVGAVPCAICHSPSVTGDSSHGTGRFPFLPPSPSIFLSVNPLRSLRSLRSRKAA